MINAVLTPDNKWIILKFEDNREMSVIRGAFTKKINDWFIIKKKNPNINVDESFINQYNMIPVGLWIELINICKSNNINITFSDDFNCKITNCSINKDSFIDYINHLFEKSDITPRQYQLDAAFNTLLYKNCCIEVATGGGKTLISYMIFRYMFDVLHLKHFLFVTPKTELTTQSADKFIQYDKMNKIDSNWSYAEIHAKAKKKEDYSETIIFGNYQSLSKKKSDFFNKFDVIMNDETQHGTCTSVRTIMRKCLNVSYKIGMTGTFPQDGSYDSFVLQSNIGPVVYKLSSSDLINVEKSATPVVISRFELNYLDGADRKQMYDLRRSKDPDDPTIGVKLLEMEEEFVHNNKERFYYVCDLLKKTTKNSLAIFSDIQNNYGYRIYETVKQSSNKSVYYIDGKIPSNVRSEIIAAMENDIAGNTIIVASIGCFSEGIDIANLWNIFLLESTKSENTLAQLLGRGMRKYEGKNKTMFIDIIDDFRYGSGYNENNYLYKHGLKRFAIYKKRNFPCNTFKIDLNSNSLF